MLIKNGIIAVGEGANTPCNLEATRAFLKRQRPLGAQQGGQRGRRRCLWPRANIAGFVKVADAMLAYGAV